MANVKTIYLPYFETGSSGIYCKILQVDTKYWLDDTDGVFRTSAVDPNVSMSEISGTMIFKLEESRSSWSNGRYHIFGYDSDNFLFSGADMWILNDTEVSESTMFEYVSLINDIEGGNWELSGNQWIYKDSSGTELMRFRTYDSTNTPSMTNIFKRTRVL